MDKVFFGIVSYGTQSSSFWVPLTITAALLHKYDIAFTGISNGKSMRADCSRNSVVQSFLKSKADWLMWIDSDNTIPLGGIRRLLDNQKEFITALYFLKQEPHTPIAYWKNKRGSYNPISGWTRGEIIPVDAAGMGACLTHRSVYEDIQKQCEVVQKQNGRIMILHKSVISGKIPEMPLHKTPSLKNGIYKEYVCKPNFDYGLFPYFQFEYNRSEDMLFYDIAAECGHKAWADTSVECDHLSEWSIDGEVFRKHVKKTLAKTPLFREYVNVEMEEYEAKGT